MATDDIAAAQAAIEAAAKVSGIDDEGDHSIALWHLLVALLEWSDAHRVDFDATLSDVRDCIARGEV